MSQQSFVIWMQVRPLKFASFQLKSIKQLNKSAAVHSSDASIRNSIISYRSSMG